MDPASSQPYGPGRLPGWTPPPRVFTPTRDCICGSLLLSLAAALTVGRWARRQQPVLLTYARMQCARFSFKLVCRLGQQQQQPCSVPVFSPHVSVHDSMHVQRTSTSLHFSNSTHRCARCNVESRVNSHQFYILFSNSPKAVRYCVTGGSERIR